jgi:hypothetical protein
MQAKTNKHRVLKIGEVIGRCRAGDYYNFQSYASQNHCKYRSKHAMTNEGASIEVRM